MQFRRPPNSDRSLESLKARLRALPQPPVPRDLESRLLASVPVAASIKTTPLGACLAIPAFHALGRRVFSPWRPVVSWRFDSGRNSTINTW